MPASDAETEGRELLSYLKKLTTPEEYVSLLAVCAGRRIYVPKDAPSPGGWIAQAIGHERACCLVSRLSKEEDFTLGGVEVEVPLGSVGIYQQMQALIKQRVVEGYGAGKTPSVIAAECGLTRRGVQMRLKRLRESGELPEPTREQIVAASYLVPTSVATKRTIEAVAVVRGVEHDGAALRPNGISAAEAAATAEDLLRGSAPAGLRGGTGRAEAIGALIVRMHGQDTAARVADLCARQVHPAIHFGAQALRNPEHPFRQVLPEREAKLLAIAVVAVGLGFEPSRVAIPGEAALRDQPEGRPVQVLYRRIREGLMAGHSVSALMASLGAGKGQVMGQLRQLRKTGLLPPAASADKHGEA